MSEIEHAPGAGTSGTREPVRNRGEFGREQEAGPLRVTSARKHPDGISRGRILDVGRYEVPRFSLDDQAEDDTHVQELEEIPTDHPRTTKDRDLDRCDREMRMRVGRRILGR